MVNKEQLSYILSHHHLDLMLDFSPDVSCDVVAQLISGALEVVDHLLELANHGVSCILVSLLSVLHMSLKLLDVYKDESQEQNLSSRKQTHLEGYVVTWGPYSSYLTGSPQNCLPPKQVIFTKQTLD